MYYFSELRFNADELFMRYLRIMDIVINTSELQNLSVIYESLNSIRYFSELQHFWVGLPILLKKVSWMYFKIQLLM